ncbi:MAG: YraN family protein [Candidatus Nitronauta litoralis]|uniref:UPF0102 protein G3M70_15100 n=1 Tax=Candidatus Nitronauta litoralis TaxID=2705533 RepID=A0A7T0BZJ4_9BACT|nr:MAG: YraN family protein [Candidatus Nitronauta litoralis]
MTFKRLSFGQDGEKRAVKFLKKNKYRILETNFTTKAGEIDIVAEQGGVLVFVEVKSRADNEHGHPLDAVTSAKQRKLIQVAERFRISNGLLGRDCRFDVVAITGAPEDPKSWKLELFQDAFRFHV